MQDVFLELADTDVRPSAPDGIAIVAADAEYDRGAYEVALEADADIPSGEPIVSGPYEQWRDRHFGAMAIRELSFVALDGERVVGYAILAQHTEGTGEHAMTGVARSYRGRGIALALKETQIAAAKEAGLERSAHAERPRQRSHAARQRETRLRAQIRVGSPGRAAARGLMRAARF